MEMRTFLQASWKHTLLPCNSRSNSRDLQGGQSEMKSTYASESFRTDGSGAKWSHQEQLGSWCMQRVEIFGAASDGIICICSLLKWVSVLRNKLINWLRVRYILQLVTLLPEQLCLRSPQQTNLSTRTYIGAQERMFDSALSSREFNMDGDHITSVADQAILTIIDPVRFAAMELATLSSLPGALAALARLNVFEALSKAGPNAQLTPAEIAALAIPGKSINITYLSRLLRMISGKKILREIVTGTTGTITERRYALEPIARFLIDDKEKGTFVHLLLLCQNDGFLRCWERLHESVVDDSVQPFERAHEGINAWEFGKRNAEFAGVFNLAMAGHSNVYMRAVLEAYKGFEDVKVLVDVGGGFASSLRLITERYPHVRGVNFDQAHVIEACPELPRVEHVAGDMFESVPNSGDAIFMKYILHDWDDESCLKILKNCYQALPVHGKVIALDNMLPEIIDFEGADSMALQSDILMLTYHDSGAQERTESDYRKLGLAAGFKQVKVVCKVDLIAVTEFTKR